MILTIMSFWVIAAFGSDMMPESAIKVRRRVPEINLRMYYVKDQGYSCVRAKMLGEFAGETFKSFEEFLNIASQKNSGAFHTYMKASVTKAFGALLQNSNHPDASNLLTQEEYTNLYPKGRYRLWKTFCWNQAERFYFYPGQVVIASDSSSSALIGLLYCGKSTEEIRA